MVEEPCATTLFACHYIFVFSFVIFSEKPLFCLKSRQKQPLFYDSVLVYALGLFCFTKTCHYLIGISIYIQLFTFTTVELWSA